MEIKTSGPLNSEKRGVGGNPLHEMSAGGRSQLVTLIATLSSPLLGRFLLRWNRLSNVRPGKTMEVEVYSGKVEAWNQLCFWIVLGLQWWPTAAWRKQVQSTPGNSNPLYNSNLPLTRSNFHFLQNIFYTTLPTITRTPDNSNFFLFPLKVRIIGSRLYMQIYFILFLIDRDEMIKIYSTESLMNFTAAPGVNALYFIQICFSKHESGMQILKHWCHAIAQMLPWNINRWSDAIRWKYGYQKWKKAGVDV